MHARLQRAVQKQLQEFRTMGVTTLLGEHRARKDEDGEEDDEAAAEVSAEDQEAIDSIVSINTGVIDGTYTASMLQDLSERFEEAKQDAASAERSTLLWDAPSH